jgi:uncharacterized protein YggE
MLHRTPVVRLVAMLALTLTVVALSPSFAVAASSEGVATIGYGMASAPAETATIRFSVIDYNYNPTGAQLSGEQVRATIQPVIDALVDAGVPEDAMEIIVGPRLVEMTKYEGPALALVRLEVANPTADRVGEIIAAATSGATAARLSLGITGVRYGIADCAALDRQAREAAIADATSRAETQAALLGIELGEVVGSRDLPVQQQTVNGPYGTVTAETSCTPPMAPVSYGASNLPPFDPTAEATVTTYAQVELTWEVAFGFGATPAP